MRRLVTSGIAVGDRTDVLALIGIAALVLATPGYIAFSVFAEWSRSGTFFGCVAAGSPLCTLVVRDARDRTLRWMTVAVLLALFVATSAVVLHAVGTSPD
jgi:hypothetical protein